MSIRHLFKNKRRSKKLLLDILEDRILCNAVPEVTLIDPAAGAQIATKDAKIGSTVNVTARFDNVGNTAAPGVTGVGYGPYIDLFIDKTGADGAGVADDDGITFQGATYLGANLVTTTLTFGPDSNGDTIPDVLHPYAVTATGAPLVVNAPAGYQEGDQLVVIQLPFGSFTLPQPAADVNISLLVSNEADSGTLLPLAARGGFQYGNDPLENPTTDPSIIDATLSAGNLNPSVLSVTKYYLGYENTHTGSITPGQAHGEIPTGPNFQQQYRIEVDIAEGQSISALQISDFLQNNMQFVMVNSVTNSSGGPLDFTRTTGAGFSTTTTPGGEIEINLTNPIVGGAGTNDVIVTFTFFVPRIDSTGAEIIDPATGGDNTPGDDILTNNNVEASGTWTPVDDRDLPASTVTSTNVIVEGIVSAESLSVQKSGTIVTDTGVVGLSPGDVVEWTITGEISDYFAYQNLILTDTISDGHHIDTNFVPVFTFSEHGTTSPSANISAANFSVALNYSGTQQTGGGAFPVFTSNPAGNDGTTGVTFRISNEMITRGFNGDLVGGGIPNGGYNGAPLSNNSPLPFGATTFTVRFRTVVLDLYTDIFPSGEPALDAGDSISNSTLLAGDLLNPVNLTPVAPTRTETDDGGASLVIAPNQISKTIYAINGNTTLPSPVVVRPGDTVTYRLQFTIPHGDVENLIIDDFLPLPVFNVNNFNITWDNSAPSDMPPAANQASRGINDTYVAASGNQPIITEPAGGNTVRFDYGTFSDPANAERVVDLLFTVIVGTDPFADGLFLTNQATETNGTTGQTTSTSAAINQIILGEPNVNIFKGVVGANNTGFTLGGVTFTAPGAGANFNATIDTNAEMSAIDGSNLSGVDSGDLVRFAIIARNTGRSDAFDVNISDTIVPGYVRPGTAAGLNLVVRRGDGTLLTSGTDYTVNYNSGTGAFSVELADGLAVAPGAGGLNRGTDNNGTLLTDGLNSIVVMYDLAVDVSARAGSNEINTASLTRFTNVEAGTNFLTVPRTNTATVTITTPTLAKALTSTEINGTGNDNTQAVVGELLTYTLTLTVPEGSTNNVVLTDVLDANLAFVGVTGVSATGGVTFTGNPNSPTVTSNGQNLSFNVGNVINSNSSNGAAETITITYTAVVLNIPANQSGTLANNLATGTYTAIDQPGASARTVNLNTVSANNVTVIEPTVTTTKTASISSGDAGDTIAYTITLAHAANDPSAFDITFSDTIPGAIAISGFTVVDSAGLVTAADFQLVGQALTTVSNFDMAAALAARTITITVNGSLTATVANALQFTNTAETRWTSLDGVFAARSTFNANSLERTGADGILNGGTLNDYRSQGTHTFTVNSPTVDKRFQGNSITADDTSDLNTTGANVAVGESVLYDILVTLPEGVTQTLRIEDVMPNGLRLDTTFNGNTGFQIISTAAASSGQLAADYNGSALSATLTAFSGALGTNGADHRLTFGSVTTTNDNVANNNSFLIRVRGIATNVIGNQNTTPTTLANVGRLVFLNPNTTADTTIADGNGNPTVTIVEPTLAVAKGINVTTGDAGDAITYTVTVSNPGPSQNVGYEISFSDTLPTLLSGAAIGTVTSSGFGAFTAPVAGDFSIVAGVLTLNNANIDIPVGGSFSITVTGTVSGTINPAQAFTNNAQLFWTSQDGTNADERGGADVAPTPGTTINAALLNNYGLSSNTVTFTATQPTINKRFQGGSLTADDTDVLTAGTNALDRVVVGEGIIYDLLVTLPEGTTPTLRITDALPPGLRLDTAFNGTGFQVITTAAASSGQLTADFSDPAQLAAAALSGVGGTLGNDGVDALLTFGNVVVSGDNVAGNNSFIVRFRAIVSDVIGNQSGTTLRNDGSLTYGATTITDATPADHDVTVIEPTLAISKNVNPSTGDAGDAITYTIVISNPNGADRADAYDVAFTDSLPNPITAPTLGTVTTAGFGGTFTAPTLANFEIVNVAGTNVLRLTAATDLDIPLGGSVTITVTGTLANNVTPGQVITNTAMTFWTSTNGTNTDERNGNDVPAPGTTINNALLNNYGLSSSAVVTAVGNPVITKTLVATSETSTTGNNVTIGETLTYAIRITLPEGATPDLTVIDRLPAGLQYVAGSAQLVTTAAASFGLLAADFAGTIAAPTVTGGAAVGDDVNATFGAITVTGDNDPNTNSFLVVLTARVANVVGNTGNNPPGQITLINDATVDSAGDNSPLQTSNTVSTPVVEPRLTTTKTLITAGTDGGDTVVYDITISNTGNARAFELNISDILDTDIELDTPATAAVLTGTPPGYVTLTDNGSNNATLAYRVNELRQGDSITIRVTGSVRDGARAGSLVTNSETVTYSSLPGADPDERDGSGGVNNYTISATSGNFTLARPTVDKQVPTDTTYSIGEQVTYDILVTIPEGTTTNLAIVDALPAGLNYIGFNVVFSAAQSGGLLATDFNGSLNTGPAVTNVGNTYTFSFGDTVASADNVAGGNAFILRVTAQIANVVGNQNATVLTNTATLTYNDGTNGASTVNDPTPNVDITIVEPVLTLVKDALGTTTNLDAGDTVQYRIVLTNTGTATAHETLLSDALPAGLLITSIDGITLAGTATEDTATAGVGSAALSGEYTIPVGGSVTILYTATLQNSVNPNTNYTNTATITYTSVDGTALGQGTPTGERNGSGGINDYTTNDTAQISTATTLLVDKTANVTTANIGDIITYTVLVTLNEGTSNNVVVTDTLPANGDLQFVAGSASIAFATAGSSISGSAVPAISGANNNVLTFSLGSVVIPTDAAANTFTLTYQVVVQNVATNQAGDNESNSARVTGTGLTPVTDITTVLLREPVLGVVKTLITSGADAGDAVQYTIAITNATGANVGAAYDIRVTDLLPATLSFTGFTIAGANVTTNSNAGNQIDLILDTLAPGATATITVNAVVAAGAPAGSTIGNTANITYTSTPGANPDERNGTGGVNDYTGSSSSANFVLTTPVVDKLTPDDLTYSIGEIVTYDILVTLPEGVTTDLNLVDVFPAGLVFQGFTVITTAAASGGNLNADYNGTVTGTPGVSNVGNTYTFGFGDVTTANDNVAGNNSFLLRVTALVADVGGNVSGTTLSNTASINYDDPTLGNNRVVNDPTPAVVSVVEPRLQITKTANDTTPDLNQLVTFTLTINHAAGSTADAFDLIVRDAMPAGLTLEGAINVVGAIIDSNNSTGTLLDLRLQQLLQGGTVTITFTARVGTNQNLVGTNIDNNARLFWDSLAADDDNAIFTGNPDGANDRDYGAGAGTEVFNANTDPAQDTERLTINSHSISGFVYLDNNGSGTFNAGDTGQIGVTLSLVGTDLLGNNYTATATTIAGGAYTFANVPTGTAYVITRTLTPLNTTDARETVGSTYGGAVSDALGSVTIAGLDASADTTDSGTNYNFGLVSSSSITTTVYADNNNDGAINGNDTRLSGETVTLTGTDIFGQAVSLTGITDVNGNFTFDNVGVGLRPGTYRLDETQPAGFLDGRNTVGTGATTAGATVNNPPSDAITGIVLGQNQAATGYLFGELRPASISGVVFLDGNNDGSRLNDPGVNNVLLTLTGTDDLGNPVNRTFTTGSTGVYTFDNLRPGTYTVTETQPPSLADGTDSIGTGFTAPNNPGTLGNDVISNIIISNVAVGNNAGVEYNFGEQFSGVGGAQIAKSIVQTSEAATGLVAGTERVAIGEIVRYRLSVELGESTFTDFTIHEQLPDGLLFLNDGTTTVAFVQNLGGVSSTSVTSPNAFFTGNNPNVLPPIHQLAGGLISSDLAGTQDIYASGSDVFFSLGNVTNTETDGDREYVVFEFNVLVVNETANQTGRTLDNTFNVLYDLDNSGAAAITEIAGSLSTPLQVQVAEPNLNITKTSVPAAGQVDGDDTITYTITLTNNAAGDNSSPAFDINLRDVLDAIAAGNPRVELSLDNPQGNSVQITAPGYATVSNNSTADTVDLGISRLNAGDSVTVTVTARVTGTPEAGAQIFNTATARYTSVQGTTSLLGVSTDVGLVVSSSGPAGSATGERDGSNVPTTTDNAAPGNNAILNNYAVAASSNTLTVQRPTIAKTLAGTSEAATLGNTVTLGEVLTYNITVTIGEGTTRNVSVADALPAGLQYLDATVDFTGSAVTSFALPAATVTGGAATGTGISFALGDLTNVADNNTANNSFTIVVTARVADVAAATRGVTLTNSASVTWNDDTTGPTTANTPTDPTVTVAEPTLQIIKSVNDATPNIGQTVTFTLVISHTAASDADAFDIRVRDAIPAGVTLLPGTINVVGATIATGSDASTGSLLDFVLDTLADGATVTITYQATVDNTLANVGTNKDNNARLYWDTLAGDEPDNSVFNGNVADNTPDRDYGATPGLIENFESLLDPAQDTERLVVNTNNIAGNIYQDVNFNGVFDGPDVLITLPVTIRLTGTSATGLAVSRDITTTDGTYDFTLLPAGDYTLTQLAQPTGYVDALENVGIGFAGTTNAGTVSNVIGANAISAINIPQDNAQSGINYNFGEVLNASLAGGTYLDTDNDGIRDAGETNLNGVPITLTGTDVYGQPVNLTVPTDGNGNYLFDGLRPGNYVISEDDTAIVPGTYLDGRDTVGTINGIITGTVGGVAQDFDVLNVTLAQGQAGISYNFAELRPASLSGSVYVDLNNDGQRIGEPGIAGVPIRLTGTDDRGNAVNIDFTGGTLADGSFSFTFLRPGTYTITEVTQPAAYGDGTDLEGTLGGTVSNDVITNISVNPGNNGTGYIFGEIGTFLSGTVFIDQDTRNGVLDAGEQGRVAGVTVELRDALTSALIATTTTDDQGNYQFLGITAGNFNVVQLQPAGYGSSTPNSLAVTVPTTGLTNQNFGETLGSIAGTVYRDVNTNGAFNQGTDIGLPGVVVTLTGTDALGNAVNLTVNTDQGGNYLFEDLLAPNAAGYTITETQPALYTDSNETVGTANGTLTAPDSITAIQLVGGNDATGYNFGEILNQPPGTGAIRGVVYRDLDRGGNFEAGEDGITGVTIRLFDNLGNLVATTTTGPGGVYTFAGLAAGNYTVTETQPINYGSSTPNTLTPVAVTVGNITDNQNFGETVGSLSGRVYFDANNNGAPAGAEPGIGGVTVTLTGTTFTGQAVTRTVLTNPDGTYTFDELLGGIYRLVETQPSDYNDGLDRLGTAGGTLGNDTSFNIGLGGGVDGVNYDFGELGANITGTVYKDVARDAVLNGTDTGIGGVSLDLLDQFGAVVATVLTNPDGTYAFTNVPIGSYTVVETQPNGYGSSTPNGVAVNVPLAGVTGINFGETTGSISGFVYQDAGDDGLGGGTEPGIGGVLLTLTGTDVNNQPVTRTTTTNPDGSYTFTDLIAGDYTVTETQPSGFNDGTESVGSVGGNVSVNDQISAIGVGPGLDVTAYNFGELLNTPPGTGTVSGRVYVDQNRDLTSQGGEPGIGGVTLELRDSGGTLIGTTTTNQDGTYSFNNVTPGAGYTVNETQPAGYGNSTPNSLPGITVVANQNSGDNNFGETTGSIAGRVFVDRITADGIQQAGEPAIAGVTIRIQGTDLQGNVIDLTTTTDANGDYRFDGLLAPNAGGYTITETQPAVWNDGIDTIGTALGTVGADTFTTIALGAGQNATAYNFAELGATISGTVFRDDDRSSALNGEPGIGGVTVQLFDSDNNLVGTTQTLADGTYSFTNLPAGNYTIVETQPDAYGSSTPNNIAAVLPLTGLTNQNFGETTGSISGVVYHDRNNNGVINLGEAIIGGVTVTLTGTDVNGAAVSLTTTTDAMTGAYSFTGLLAGTYTVIESQPAAYVDGRETLGDVGGNPSVNDRISAIGLGGGAQIGGYLFGERTPTDMVVTKTDNVEVVRPGDELTYIMTVSNRSLQDAEGVVVTDVLPKGLKFISADNGGVYDELTRTITWNLGYVNGANEEIITLTVRADVLRSVPAGVEVLDNIITATDRLNPGPEPTPADNTATDRDRVIAAPDLYVTKTDNLLTTKVGQTITYTIKGGNAGNQVAADVIIRDVLPKGLRFVSATNGGKLVDGEIVWNLGELRPDQVFSLTVTVTVETPAAGKTLENVVTITDRYKSFEDPTPKNNRATDTTSVPPLPVPPPVNPFAFDTFNNFSRPRQSSDPLGGPLDYVSSPDITREPLLPLAPIYSGESDPGSVLVLNLYNNRGQQIGTQTVVVDSGGNWLATFPSSSIKDTPSRVSIAQLAPSYSTGAGTGFNTRAYYSPALNPGHFFQEHTGIGIGDTSAPLLRGLLLENTISLDTVKYGGELLTRQAVASGF